MPPVTVEDLRAHRTAFVRSKRATVTRCAVALAPCACRGTRNLSAVQVLLEHATIATTERYLAVDDSEILAGDVGCGWRLLNIDATALG